MLWAMALLPAIQLKGAVKQAPDTLAVHVDGLCGMCRSRIEKAAMLAKGVESASWEMDTRILTVVADPAKFKPNRLHYRVASVGHDTEELLAPDPVYESLPMCCKYRDFATHDEALGYDPGSGDPASAEVTGFVYESGKGAERKVLSGASVYWMGSTVGTITDENGLFTIPHDPDLHMLVVSFVGYGSDTLHVAGPSEVEVGFSNATALEEVTVTHRIKPTSISFSSAYNIQNIHEKELTKAACCNLSESFETNPSVDASFTDAVTGTRKIEMLGLAGPYVQVTRESMPDVRGLSSLFGLTYTPGTWIEGIQLSMGAGSVVNGFESITGQINVELRKPEKSDRLFVNLYGNGDGAAEINVMNSYAMSEKWHGSLLLHGNARPFGLDHNGDGFLDHPTGNNLVALKRFKYSGEDGFESQLGIKAVYSDRIGGQVAFDPETPRSDQSFWGTQILAKRIEIWAKAGKVFPDRPFSSLGLQVSGLVHDQDAFFGLNDYLAKQQSLYANLIYQSILGNTNHQYRTGVSYQLDSYGETLTFGTFNRLESVPGAFLEYTFNHLDLFTVVAGVRADYHNSYGAFVTPRLHVRYEPVPRTVFKASAGRGQKTATVFAEQIGIFASSRAIMVHGDGSEQPYGLDPEVAWSYGLNFGQGFTLGQREAVFNADFYHTRFISQVVVDLDRASGEVHFYNLDGRSFSNSLQLQLDLEPVERYDIRLAYRLNDVQTTYDGEVLSRPLTAKNRAFVNMAYETVSRWTFDVTWNWQDRKRIPGTSANPDPYRRDDLSPEFALINLQLGKGFGKRLEVYTGVENVLDFKQADPIISGDDPFGPYFDSSLIWGPIFGRKFYGGLRFRIN